MGESKQEKIGSVVSSVSVLYQLAKLNIHTLRLEICSIDMFNGLSVLFTSLLS